MTLSRVSPNGEPVAFTSAHEALGERDTNGMKLDYNEEPPEMLLIFTFATGHVTTLGLADDSFMSTALCGRRIGESCYYTPGRQIEHSIASL